MITGPKAGTATYDFVIVGGGAAAVCAALVVKKAGRSALILEKEDHFGGSTALSGGVIWAPNSSVIKRAGVPDSMEEAALYLDSLVGAESSRARRQAFLTECPLAIDFLERHHVRFQHVEGYSDYHEGEHPGANARGRSILVDCFNARRLGPAAALLTRGWFPPMKVPEGIAAALNGRTLKSALGMAKIGTRMVQNRLGRDIVGAGTALQGRLLEVAQRNDVAIWTGAAVCELISVGRGVAGVVARIRGGDTVRVAANVGVLVNAGGFARSIDMRRRFQKEPASVDWTNASAGDTGELIEMAMELGAATELMDQSWWNPVSLMPSGARPPHAGDMSKPFAILVDSSGKRYVNESTSYVALGNAMYARHKTVPAIPSWLILDSRHRERYRWAGCPAGKTPREWISSGYMLRADTLDALAAMCRVPIESLQETIARFNGFARAGLDADFGRGRGAFHRYYGDPTVKPNPNLGAIERPPFYAVKLYPGDVGTCGGLMTDEYGRVLKENGELIRGLYATGNSTASLFGRSYPGAGASIAAALVFGWIAAKDAMTRADVRRMIA